VLHLLAVVARPILRRTLILFISFKDLKTKREKEKKIRNVSDVLGILVLNSRVFVSLVCNSVAPVSHNNTQFIIVSVIFWNHNTSVGLVTGNGGACCMLKPLHDWIALY
jgi:hypothetical protein